jgi:hypothetical protein
MSYPSFVQQGDDAIKESEARNAINTNRIFRITKDLKIVELVPLADFVSDGTNQTILAYDRWEGWIDTDSLETFKKDNDIENMSKFINFPMIHPTDPDIDPGLWLKKNLEEVDGADVKFSSEWSNDPKDPFTVHKVYLLPCVWVNNPDLNGEEPFEEHVFEYKQKTIHSALRGFYDAAGVFRGNLFKISKDKGGKSFSAINLGEYDGFKPTELTVEMMDYIGFTTRQAIVDKLAVIGINVPPVPKEKQHILDAIEGN